MNPVEEDKENCDPRTVVGRGLWVHTIVTLNYTHCEQVKKFPWIISLFQSLWNQNRSSEQKIIQTTNKLEHNVWTVKMPLPVCCCLICSPTCCVDHTTSIHLMTGNGSCLLLRKYICSMLNQPYCLSWSLPLINVWEVTRESGYVMWWCSTDVPLWPLVESTIARTAKSCSALPVVMSCSALPVVITIGTHTNETIHHWPVTIWIELCPVCKHGVKDVRRNYMDNHAKLDSGCVLFLEAHVYIRGKMERGYPDIWFF